MSRSIEYDNRENCTFYYKIGVCRHGDKCSKKHGRPINSPTIIIYNMFMLMDSSTEIESIEKEYNNFYEDVFLEASKFGEVQEIVVCENKTDHLNGNVYIRFNRPEEARIARDSFNTRWYDKRPLYCDLCHVVNFQEAICRSHQQGTCDRGEQCNFIHERKTNTELVQALLLSQWKSRHIQK